MIVGAESDACSHWQHPVSSAKVSARVTVSIDEEYRQDIKATMAKECDAEGASPLPSQRGHLRVRDIAHAITEAQEHRGHDRDHRPASRSLVED